jgi:peroxiredoxin
VDLGAMGLGRTVLYLYPLTGRPGRDLPDGWETIPGARGCTAQACDFRDHHRLLRAAGVDRVYGLSSQSEEYQAELVRRLRLPFDMISDPHFEFAEALRLPTFEADGLRLYRRLTLIIAGARVRQVFYPVDQPETHAQEVLRSLR